MRRLRWSGARGLFGLLLLWLPFLPDIGPDRHLIVDLRPPLPLVALLILFGLWRWAQWRLAPAMRWGLAALLFALAVIQGVNAGVEHSLDRPLDLYFDLRHVPSLLGLYRDSVGAVRGGLSIAAALLALTLLLALLAYALTLVDQAMRVRPNLAPAAVLAGFLGIALLPVPNGWAGRSIIDDASVSASWHQSSAAWHAFAALRGLDPKYTAALAAPPPPLTALPGLKGRDVYLIFIESFGTIGLDEPAYRAVLQPALDNFATSVKAAGYQLLSSRLVSPTYGGGSWLAHGTIATGVKLDMVLDELVINGNRRALPRYMAAAGYRTVEMMPGIKQAYPESAFWGFDKNYYAADLGYRGPEFGWFTIPDQYTLEEFAAHELKPDHAPLFAQIVLVSSHTPFAPVPPYLSDWRDAGSFKSVPQADWARIYTPPQWSNLDRSYLDSIAYDLKTLSAWLAQRDRDALVIILGDHQPPDLTRGNDQLWTVPIYVLSRDADLVRPFAALGYGPGAAPLPRPNPEGMEKFLGEFLTGFGPSLAAAASTPPQSPGAPAVSQP
jgi:Sulfatase